MPKKKDASQPYFAPGEEQGMLARPAFWMTSRQRYPRGFTPERQRDVNTALSNTQFNGLKEEQAKVRETIARSTVPTEHLRDFEEINAFDPKRPPLDHKAETPGRVLAYYRPVDLHPEYGADVQSQMTVEQPMSKRLIGDMPELEEQYGRKTVHNIIGSVVQGHGRAVIHEIGHHVQNLAALERRDTLSNLTLRKVHALRTSHVARKNRDANEADAENYADEHFREDRRLPADEKWGYYDSIYADQPDSPYWQTRVRGRNFVEGATGASKPENPPEPPGHEQLGLF